VDTRGVVAAEVLLTCGRYPCGCSFSVAGARPENR